MDVIQCATFRSSEAKARSDAAESCAKADKRQVRVLAEGVRAEARTCLSRLQHGSYELSST